MTAMNPLRNILNDTPATAIDVDWNFQAIEDYIATDVVKRDGSVAMEAPLNLLGAPPTVATHAVPKSYVDNVIPIGTIWQFAGGPGAVGVPQTVPAGWALCDGASKSTTQPDYAALFAVIGYTYGGSGGSFNLPNLQSRFPVGRSALGDASFDALGETGGNRNATLPTHQHDIAHGHAHTISATTNVKSTDHYHDINHDHGSFSTNGDGDHGHTYPTQANNTAGPNAAQGGNNTGGVTNQAVNQGPGQGGHLHTIDVPNFTGTSNWQSQVGGSTQHQHDHAVTVSGGVTNAPNGTLSNQQGSDPTNANLPPYITINFIIRIG